MRGRRRRGAAGAGDGADDRRDPDRAAGADDDGPAAHDHRGGGAGAVGPAVRHGARLRPRGARGPCAPGGRSPRAARGVRPSRLRVPPRRPAGYRVRYVRPPIREDASGRVLRVAGEEFLSVRMEPASGFALVGSLGETYTGPTRIAGSSAGTEVLAELVRGGDFGAVLTWVAGLQDRVPFRVLTLTAPPRIVVDVRTP